MSSKFEKTVNNMNVGAKLLEAPVPLLIENLAKSIAKAQYELDSNSVKMGVELGDTRLTFTDRQGESYQRSLLELGFLPNFYQFRETDIEVKMSITLKVDQDDRNDLGFNAGTKEGEDNKLPLAFGATLDVDHHIKYGFSQEGSSLIRTKLVAIPPPNSFVNAITESSNAQSSLLNDTPPPPSEETEDEEDDVQAQDNQPTPEPEPEPEPEPVAKKTAKKKTSN